MASKCLPLAVSADPNPPPAAIESEGASEATSAPNLMPVLRPRLPSTAKLLPYLQAIEDRRWYSNHGPLVTCLERELSNRLGVADGGVVTTANGTVGLTVALLARDVPPESVCIMPAWTFAATPHAARLAGMTPWFHDVDRSTWALDPGQVTETLKGMACRVGSVLVVSPFGAPLDISAWEAFEAGTGVSVVVDAAAGFDTVRPSRIPSVVSLHATKILGAGEGGFIVSSDWRLRERAAACSNFGFAGSRIAIAPALNAKMSEYHAAVALASLEGWSATRMQHARIAEWYRESIGGRKGISLQPGYGNGWVGGTTNVVLPAHSAVEVARHLLQLGIETRTWWGQGCHVQPAFAHHPRGPLPVTDELGSHVLGLPHFADMQKRDVDAVVDALSECLGSRTTDQIAALSDAVSRTADVPVRPAQDLEYSHVRP